MVSPWFRPGKTPPDLRRVWCARLWSTPALVVPPEESWQARDRGLIYVFISFINPSGYKYSMIVITRGYLSHNQSLTVSESVG